MKLLESLRGDYVKLAFVMILVASVLRFALAALSHPAGDSCWHLSVARFMAETGRMPFDEPFGILDRQFFSAAPLFHFAAAAVYRFFGVFGASEFSFRLVSAFFGSVTLPFVFLIGRKMFSPRAGFLAALFVAFLPLHMNSSIVSFVDALAALLATLVVYFILQKRFFLSAFFVGLGMEAKQTMAVLAPLLFLSLFVCFRRNILSLLKKSAMAGLIMAVVGLPWFVRNYLLLGNPVWPFMARFFGGVSLEDISGGVIHPGFSVANLLDAGNAWRFYLELMGAPIGSLNALSFVQLPFMGLVIAAWVALILAFMVPVVFGIARSRRSEFSFVIYGWLFLFLLLEAAFIANTGLVSARYFLPAAPALALLWALGIESIIGRISGLKLLKFAQGSIPRTLVRKFQFQNSPRVLLSGVNARAILAVAVVGCILAFSAVEAAKTFVAASSWNSYGADFQWVKENTPPDALVGYRGQCLGYNIHRLSNFDLAAVDYVWINQGFAVEPGSILEPGVLQVIEGNFTKVYENPATGTMVYGRK